MSFPAATSTSRTAESAPPAARRPEPVRDTTAPTRVEPPAYMGGRTTRTDATAPATRDARAAPASRAAPPLTRDVPTAAVAPAARDIPISREATRPVVPAAATARSAPAARDVPESSTPEVPVSDVASASVDSVAAGAATVASSVGASAFAAALENSEYFVNLGSGFTISLAEGTAAVNLEDKPQVLPGFRLLDLTYRHQDQTATVRATVTIPHLRTPRDTPVTVSIDANGNPSFSITLESDLPVFRNKSVTVSLNEQRQLSAELVIAATDLMPSTAISNLTITGGGTFTLSEGKLQGNVSADLAYASLGSGHFNANFNTEGQASGDGTFTFDPEFLHGATASLAIDEQANLHAQVAIPISDINTPIPGLSITEGTITFSMDNSRPSGELTGLKLAYSGLAEATINASIRNGVFAGGGDFAVTISELTDATGHVAFDHGILTGNLTITSTDFPEALHVESGSITATLTPTNDIDLAGEARILLGPAGEGQLRASRENGLITIGANIALNNIPGLQSANFSLLFTSEGTVEGEADIATDDSLIPGLTGSVHLTYRDNLWSGETEINFTKEGMSINGTILVGVRQTEEGTLAFHGSGELSAEIVPGVVGTVGVEIDEEGAVTLTMAFTQTEPWELFEEQRQEREFLNISRNIPVFAAIVVAVIRLRAGVRAGIGPGQIRNTRVEGTWVITSDAPPDISVSSEFFMPAFVEGYVAFGAGLGVDVLLGSLTGGLEGVATAGIYGAVSVVPELSYENGDWLFDGTATLAAGARLKLSLNAWAEIEALWVTVWEESWELAEHTMNIGPDLVLRANVAMNLSNPSVPELTFESSDVDADGLIDSAMPADGPPSAGTREALENRAEWAGNSRAAGDDADSVPPELAAQANESEPAPAAPPHPSGHAGPAPETAEEAPPAESSTSAATSDAVDANAPATVDGPRVLPVPESEIPNVDQPRFPNGISLAMLDEPHVQMPRTAAQEREDLDAAVDVFNLVEAQAEDSEQLAAYFERIRVRFQLTFIGYEADGDETVVRVEINPVKKLKPDDPVRGRGILGKVTEIVHTPGRLTGSPDSVGVEMLANPLGPDHPEGSIPQSGAQTNLMGSLPGEHEYVRGHLLNGLVGGEGKPSNLFPITVAANNAHKLFVENHVKKWVDDRYWVYYKVTINVGSVDLTQADRTLNKVNSSIRCLAHVISLNGGSTHPINQTITSTYLAPATTSAASPTASEAADIIAARAALPTTGDDGSAREGCRGLTVESYILDLGIYDEIKAALSRRVSRTRIADRWVEVKARLSAIRGLDATGTRLQTLQDAYNHGKGVDLVSVLSTAEKANLTTLKNLAEQIKNALKTI